MDVAQVRAWRAEIDSFRLRFSPVFPRQDLRERGWEYIKALASDVERKNSWQIAEHAGEEKPYPFQRLLGRASWDEEALRDETRRYACEHLLSKKEAGVLIVDETGFEKKGKKSAGVAPQYSGTAGCVVNCQIGVFVALASSQGRMLIDRELYLPKCWTEDRARCDEAHVPEEREFLTKPQLAMVMIGRALDAGMKPEWVLGDEVYGNDGKFRLFLEALLRPHVLGVKCTHRVFVEGRLVEVSTLPGKIKARRWFRLSIGKDPCRMYDFAALTLGEASPAGFKPVLLIRKHIQTGECAYFLCFAPQNTTGQQLAQVSGQR